MRARALVLSCVLLAAGLAGCVGGDDSGSDVGTTSTNDTSDISETNDTDTSGVEPEDTGPNVTVHWHNGTVQGQDLPDPLGWYCGPPGGCSDNVLEFNATNATTGIVAQVAWNASVELEVDLDVPPEPCETNFPFDTDCQPDSQTGQSPIEYRVTNSQDLYAGEWEIEVWPQNNPNTPAEYTIAVGVFEDGSIPGSWSKLPSG